MSVFCLERLSSFQRSGRILALAEQIIKNDNKLNVLP